MNIKHKAYIYLLATTSIWGGLYVASKFVMDSVPPFTLLFLRYFIAVIILYFIYRIGKHEKIQKEDYKYIIAIGFIGYFLGIGLQLLGTHLCNASLASLINSINPVIIVILAIPILKEKVTLHKIIAVGVTVIGAIIIVGHVDGESAIIGVFVSMGSVIAWSLSSVLVRFVSKKYDSLTITMYGMGLAVVFAFPTSMIELVIKQTTWPVITPVFLLALIYIIVISTSFSLLLWNKALSMVDAATCSLFYPVQPFVSTLLGVLLLDEVITKNFVIGGVFITCGILYAILMDTRKPCINKTSTEILGKEK